MTFPPRSKTAPPSSVSTQPAPPPAATSLMVPPPSADPLLSPDFLARLGADSLTNDDFTGLVAQAVAYRHQDAKVVVVAPLHIHLERAAGSGCDFFLQNVWADSLAAPRRRADTLAQYLLSWPSVASSTSSTLALDDIVPLVRQHAYLDECREATRGNFDVPRLPFVGDLVILFARDAPASMNLINSQQLASLHIELNDLLRRSLSNLAKRLPTIAIHADGPVYMVTAGGNFEASLLLVDAVCDDLAARVSGDLVVAVPARDLLFFTGSNSPQGLSTLQTTSSKMFTQASHSVSPTLLTRRHGVWQVYLPSTK